MSVTVNKPLSPAKELFLSIAPVAQEISSDTIREMKKRRWALSPAYLNRIDNKSCFQRRGQAMAQGFTALSLFLFYGRKDFENQIIYGLTCPQAQVPT